MHDDFQTRLLIELQRIAGALEGSEKQLECLCQHFGASPKPRNRKPNAKGADQ